MAQDQTHRTTIKTFLNLLHEQKIWYSIIKETLFDYATTNSQKDHHQLEKLEIMMTWASYQKLTQICNQEVFDGSFDPQHGYLHNQYKLEAEQTKLEQQINIYLIVPTTIPKIKKFLSRKNKFIYARLMRRLHPEKTSSRKERQFAFWGWWKVWLVKQMSYKDVYNLLYDAAFTCYYIIDSPFAKVARNWIPNLNFKTEVVHFQHLKMHIINEWKPLLRSQYEVELRDLKLKN